MLAQRLMGSLSGQSIEFVSSSINRVASGANTVTAPTGIQNGDLLVAYSFVDQQSNTVTLPSGFVSHLLLGTAASSQSTLVIATKVASGESGNYSFTWSNSGRASTAAILVYRDASNASRTIGSEGVQTTTATVTAPSISPSSKGALLAFFADDRVNTVLTAPSGMTQRAVQTSAVPPVAIYELLPSPSGATGSKSLTWGTSSTFKSAILMQIDEA